MWLEQVHEVLSWLPPLWWVIILSFLLEEMLLKLVPKKMEFHPWQTTLWLPIPTICHFYCKEFGAVYDRSLKLFTCRVQKEEITYRFCLYLFGGCSIRSICITTPWSPLLSGFGWRCRALSVRRGCWFSRVAIHLFSFGYNQLFWSTFWRWWFVFLLDETTTNMNSIPQDWLR